jgi:hypothetical protein
MITEQIPLRFVKCFIYLHKKPIQLQIAFNFAYDIAVLNGVYQMKKFLLISVLGSGVLPSNVLADACDGSNPAEISALYGADMSAVKEEKTYERKTTSECMWSFQDKEGRDLAITFRTFDKTEKITNPNFFLNNQKYLVDHGKKIGKWDLKYQFEAFPDTEHGVLSNIYGNRFTKSLHYVWVQGEERRLEVTFSSTMNENGELVLPTTEDMKQAVEIFTN